MKESIYHPLFILLLIVLSFMLLVCLIRAMISFLSVVVISKVYIGIYEEQHHKQENAEGGNADERG